MALNRLYERMCVAWRGVCMHVMLSGLSQVPRSILLAIFVRFFYALVEALYSFTLKKPPSWVRWACVGVVVANAVITIGLGILLFADSPRNIYGFLSLMFMASVQTAVFVCINVAAQRVLRAIGLAQQVSVVIIEFQWFSTMNCAVRRPNFCVCCSRGHLLPPRPRRTARAKRVMAASQPSTPPCVA